MGTLSYRIEPAAGGRVDLFLDVPERVTLTGVYFQGNDRLSKRLTELLSLAAGQTVTTFQVRAMEQQIIDAYKQAGYPLASDRAVLGNHGTGARDITSDVAEGPRLYVAGVAFSGNTHIPAGSCAPPWRARCATGRRSSGPAGSTSRPSTRTSRSWRAPAARRLPGRRGRRLRLL